MSHTVQFNVGGSVYKISRSLLDSNANSMFSRSASEEWQKDKESEIFIERDGSIFRFVLSYMRDGKVFLPITESKEAVLAELEYYGIEVPDEDQINDSNTRQAICISSLQEAVKEFEETCRKKKACMENVEREYKDRLKNVELEYRCSKFALDIVSKIDVASEEITIDFNDEDKHKNVWQLLKMHKDDEIKKMVDKYLSSVGLKLTGFLTNIFDGTAIDVKVRLTNPCTNDYSKEAATTPICQSMFD